MKPGYEKIIPRPEHSFVARVVTRDSRSHLSDAWHYHPEIEICYTTQSAGKRFVGNQLEDYLEGDLVMFGTNLPHGFVTSEYSSQVVIQLNHDFLGEDFILKPELKGIRNIYEDAKRGLEFGSETKAKAIPIIKKLLVTDRMEQLIHLLSLLNLLAESKDVRPICSEEYAIDVNVTQLSRVKLVYDYVMLHYNKDVSIREIADKLNLSEAGFYKFIKKQTKKSYTQIVNEYRVSHACRQLIDSQKTISQVSFECGFNNQSYFNRKFKQIMKMTPNEFKVRYGG